MIAFLTLLYCAVLFLLVRFGVIRLNTFWKFSPVLWFLFLFVFLFIPMQWGAPAGPVRTYNPVIEIFPNVAGEVVEVPANSLDFVAKGDVLFKIDPVPFQAIVDRTSAQLAEARQEVPKLKANLEAMVAAVAEAEANRDRAKDEYDRFRTGNENARQRGNAPPFSELDVEQRRLIYVSADAGVSRARANAEQARLAYETEIDGVNTTVARLEADLRKAKFDLDQTTVRAPANGYPVGLTLKPGQRVASAPMRTWLAFVPLADRRVVVAIPQTQLRHVKPGQPAEVTFAYHPGKIYQATTEYVVPMNASGQLPPSGTMPSLASHLGPNELVGVLLQLKDLPPDMAILPGGSDGTAAIYTQSAQITHVIRRVMIRMDAWLNYLRPN